MQVFVLNTVQFGKEFNDYADGTYALHLLSIGTADSHQID